MKAMREVHICKWCNSLFLNTEDCETHEKRCPMNPKIYDKAVSMVGRYYLVEYNDKSFDLFHVTSLHIKDGKFTGRIITTSYMMDDSYICLNTHHLMQPCDVSLKEISEERWQSKIAEWKKAMDERYTLSLD